MRLVAVLCGLALLLVPTTVAQAPVNAVITAITPNEGSLNGGTTIRLLGTGFSRGGQEGLTTVTLGSNTCETIEYHSGDAIITCVTPPSGHTYSERVSVVVTMIGISFAGTAACSTDCRFYYRTDATPTVWGYTWDVIANSAITFYGRLYGSTIEQFDIRFDDTLCDLEEDINEEELSRDSRIYCVANEQPAGRRSLNFITEPTDSDFGYGRAGTSDYLQQVDLWDGTPYDLTVRPRITGISSNTGGALGGGHFVITGTGFDSSNSSFNTVMLGDVPCIVKSVSDDEIVCTPGAYSGPTVTTGYYSGPAGLLDEIWLERTNNGFELDSRYPDSPSEQHINTQGGVTLLGGVRVDGDYAELYFERLTGFLTPPETGTFIFHIKGDDVGRIALSNDTTPDNLNVVAYYSRWRSAYRLDSSQVSEPMALTKGDRYFVELRNMEGSGADGLDLAVQIVNATWASDAAKHRYSIREVQTIDLDVDITYEVQTFGIHGATSGTFFLSTTESDGDSVSTDGIPFDASASEVDAALTAVRPIEGCWSFGVSRTEHTDIANVTDPDTMVTSETTVITGYTWAVTWQCTNTRADYPLLVVSNRAVDPLRPTADIRFDDVVRTTSHGELLDGTYRLSLNGTVWSDPIDYNAGTSSIVAALESTDPTKQVTVSRSSSSLTGYTYTVTFVSSGDQVPILVDIGPAGNTTLTGDNANVEILTLADGDIDDLFLDPIPSDWFEMSSALPAVHVTVNGIKAACDAPAETAEVVVEGEAAPSPPTVADLLAAGSPCNYVYDDTVTPTLTAISATSGVVQGDTLTFTGTGFPTDNTATVTLGSESDIPCVTDPSTPHTATSLTCTVGAGPAGTYTPTLSFNHIGAARNDAGLPDITVDVTITAISPLTGSILGGTPVSFEGTGFQQTAVVTIGGAPCVVTTETFHDEHSGFHTYPVTTSTTLTCITSAAAADATAPIVVDGVTAAQTFDLSVANTPSSVTFSPTVISAAITSTLTVTVGGVSADLAALGAPTPMVMFDDRLHCHVVEWAHDTSTEDLTITCHMMRGDVPAAPQPDALDIEVTVYPLGVADSSSAPTLDRRFAVTSIAPSSPTVGLLGGAVLTLDGFGFESTLTRNVITINHGDHEHAVASCVVLSATANQLECEVKTSLTPEDPSAVAATPEEETGDGHEHRRLLALSPDHSASVAHKLNTDQHPLRKRLLHELVDTFGDVLVTINDLEAACDGASADACLVTLTADATPDVTHVVDNNGTVSISGRDLIADGAVVETGAGAPCVVDMSASDTTNHTLLVCTKATSEPASTQYLHVIIAGMGYATIHADLKTLSYPLSVTEASLVIGSAEGGTVVQLTGQGFKPSDVSTYSGVPATMVVTVGGAFATIIDSTATTITVRTPAYSSSLGVGETAGADIAVSITSGWEDELSSTVTATLANGFTYSGDHTPTISRISPNTPALADAPARGTAVVISGTGFEANQTTSTVRVGENGDCAVTAWSDTEITCTLGDTPAGRNPVFISITGKGYAKTSSSVRFTAGVTVAALSLTTGSFVGGQRVTLSGEGFSTANRTVVKVCGVAATVEASSYDSITFATPEFVSLDSIDAFNHLLPDTMTGASIIVNRASSGSFDRAFDSDPTTYMGGWDWANTWYGYDYGEHHLAKLTRVRFYPRLKYASRVEGGVVEGSNDCHMETPTWTHVATFSDVQEGWNWVDVSPDTPTYRCLRYFGPDGGYSQLAELRFVGHHISSYTDAECAVTVEVNADATSAFSSDSPVIGTSSDTYRYLEDATPYVDSLTPDQGTALGGTEVTISGGNFDTDMAALTVLLNGVECEISAVTSTAITCTTAPRGSTFRDFSISVFSPSTGFAALDADTRTWFRYLDKWSARNTWLNDEPPLDGDTVVIPYGQAVVLDVPAPKLFLLVVQGMLVFDHDATVPLTLDATYIFIFGGVLEVGTESRPFMGDATITLHGDRWKTIEIPEIGAKCLAVTDWPFVHHDHSGADTGDGSHGTSAHSSHTSEFRAGVLDIHGAPRKRSWTKIAASTPAGATSLTTAEDVDWGVGDHLVVTCSERACGMSETQEVVVTAVLGPRELEFDPPLRQARRAEILTEYTLWTPVDLRPEVGLLSRNVVVQGNEASTAQLFGVHSMALHAATYRIENSEFRRCGQGGVLGRYCLHFHMMGSRPDNYIRNNAIHHSFQRATTIHATDDVHIAHNVAYDVRGHTYFVEDGNEVRAFFDENLGVVTRRHGQLLKSDTKPATFWTPTPRCFWRHNVAAGSAAHGFWFELRGHPNGPSFTTSMCPHDDVVGSFFNNTFHSNGGNGLRVYPHWQPHVDPCDDTTPEAPQYLYNLTSFRNGGAGVFHRDVGSLHHIGYKLVENGDEIHWKKLKGVFGPENNPYYQHLLAIGSIDAAAPASHVAMWAPHTEYWHVGPATLVNYGNGAIRGCFKCSSQTSLRQGGYTVRFEGLTFINTPQRVQWSAPYKQIFHDLDGTLTGHTDGMTSPYWSFNDHGSGGACSQGGIELQNGIVCDGTVPIRRMQLDRVEPHELDFKMIAVNSTLGVAGDMVPFLPKELYGWVFPAVANTSYHVHWYTSVTEIDWQTLFLRYSEPVYVTPGEWLGFSSDFVDHRHEFEVMYGSDWIPPLLNRLPAPTDPHGTGAMGLVDDSVSNQTWHVILNDLGAYRANDYNQYGFEISAMQCPRLIGCPLPPPPSLGTASAWSDPDTWAHLGHGVPEAGDSVTITETMHVLLDVSPPLLGSIRIEGRLEFVDVGPLTLECESIAVLGDLFVGTTEFPRYYEARIVLHGVRTSPTVIVDNDYFLGNKMIAVFGTASFVGRTHTQPWTKLSQPAAAGDRVLHLVDSIEGSWFAGDEIVISPTEYDQSELEVATITGIRDGGLTVDLAEPLAYGHFQGTIPIPTDGTFSEEPVLAAAVGGLYRNVVLEGADPDAQSENYGAHLVVGAIRREVDDGFGGVVLREFTGTLHATGVQFDHFGKMGTEHPSIKLKYNFDFESNPENVIDNCAFSNSYNYAFVTENVKDVVIENNVIHGGFRSGFFMDRESTGAVINNNLVIGTSRSPDDLDDWLHPFASFYLDTTPAELSGNLAAGSGDVGFTVRAPACSSSVFSEGKWGNNEAHSVQIGAFLLSHTADGENCVRWEGFTVWKATHVGILSVDMTSNLVVEDVVVSDNHIGMSFNFFGGRDTGNFVEINDAIVMGSTPASTSCSASLDCRAQDQSDLFGLSCRSVFGSDWRRVGVVSSQWTNRAKTCDIDGELPVCRPPSRPERLCGLPWEKRFGLPSNNEARMVFDDVLFAYWNKDDCGRRSAALVHNPSQIDWTPPLHFNGVRWADTADADAHIYFGADGARSECSASPPSGLGSNCDSFNFGIMNDEDGTLTGDTGATIIPNTNPAIAAASPACSEDIESGVFVCPGLNELRQVVLRDRDRNAATRRIGPIVIKRVDPVHGNETYYSVGPHDDPCPKRFFFPRYPWLIAPGYRYEMHASGTLPGNTRFYFHSDDTTESALIALFVQKPNEMEFFVDGVKVDRMTSGFPELSDPAGTNLFNPQERHIYFILRGGSQRYDIVRTPNVQLNVQLAISVEEFFADDFISNLATLLEIDSSRIKIVSVHAGSTVVTTQIGPDGDSAIEEEEQEVQYAEQEALGAKIVELVQEGDFDVGFELEGTPELFVPDLEDPAADIVTAPVPEKKSKFPTVLVLSIVGGALVIGSVAALFMVWHRRGPSSPRRSSKVASDVEVGPHAPSRTFALDNPMHNADTEAKRTPVPRQGSRANTHAPPSRHIDVKEASPANRLPGTLPSPTSRMVPSATAAGYSRFWDPSHKRFFYFHASTQVSSWTKPEGWIEPPRTHDWHRVFDTQESKVYYYNDVTGETSWKVPPEVEEEERLGNRDARGLAADSEKLIFTPTRARATSSTSKKRFF